MQQSMNLKNRIRTDYIIVHCAATPPNMDIGAQEIEIWHRKRGFLTIGYHYVVRRDGTLEVGRPVDAVGAHVTGKNSVSVGICLVGGVASDKRTPEMNYTNAQMQTLRTLIDQLRQRYPSAVVAGHREFAAKACPCFDVRAWYEDNKE